MAKRDQLRRLLEIDRRVRAGEYPSVDQLAVELEVTRRAIFNDRAYLVNVLGAPLKYSRQHQGWYYAEATWTLPNLMVTRGELLAFVLAVEAAQHPLGPLLQEELRTAVKKIADGLRGRVEVDLASLSRHFTFASPPPAPFTASALASVAPHILMLNEAIEGRKVVSLLYYSARRNRKGWRRVHPHHIHNDEGQWRFFAFDPAVGEMRTFNVARIESMQILPETFISRADFSPRTFLSGSFRHELGPQTHTIVVRFDAEQAPYISERLWHKSQELEEQADGGLILRFQASGLGEIARWVLSYGAHAEVLEPPSLRSAVAAAARALARLYDTGDDSNFHGHDAGHVIEQEQE